MCIRDRLWLAVAVVIFSAVSAFYYLRVVAVMYFDDPDGEPRQTSTGLLNFGIGAMVVATIALGLFSGPVVDLADEWRSALDTGETIVGGR